MRYKQLTSEERYALGMLLQGGNNLTEIGVQLKRSTSTISRELRRNSCPDGYRPSKAHSRTKTRRSHSRRNRHFTERDMAIVEERLLQKLSPEQVSGRLKREGILSISHECIYQHVYRDEKAGGELFSRLRVKWRNYRKRRNGYERRGKLVGKRTIEERPPIVESRSTIGHWEADTVMGKGSRDCILTLVERMTGYTLIGKLESRTVKEVNRRARRLICRHRNRFATITADNGTEFHGYKRLEKLTGVEIYFANPHQSWERGTNENTNGLIRQYIPKGRSMAGITQVDCNRIARELNDRPRKRLEYQSPNECYNVALQT